MKKFSVKRAFFLVITMPLWGAAWFVTSTGFLGYLYQHMFSQKLNMTAACVISAAAFLVGVVIMFRFHAYKRVDKPKKA